ncbi:MAG: hypothetical protein GDA45_04150 [Chromatiales bacterium]|nr:hypothetical protein [Chromatiales bacterium]
MSHKSALNKIFLKIPDTTDREVNMAIDSFAQMNNSAIKDAIKDLEARMATKDDIRDLEARMATKDDIKDLEARMATKDDIKDLEIKLSWRAVYLIVAIMALNYSAMGITLYFIMS